MKVLVTGGTGLVGYAINQISKDYDYDFIFLSSKDCDLSNFDDTNKLFEREKPEYVIHLAACVGGLFKNMSQKVDMFEKNIEINMNVLKCAHNHKVKKLVSILSTCIFPDETTYPINETMLHDGPPHNSNDAYAYAKRMLEVHSKAYREQYGDNFICVIPTNIYGPNDNYHFEDSHVIPGLIHKCLDARKHDDFFEVRGTGKPVRQFIYSEDLAKLIMWTLEKYEEKDTLILSVDEDDEVSIETVARLIASRMNWEHRLIFDDSYSDGQYKKTANNRKLKSLVDYKFMPLKKGIKKSVRWFIKNYDIARK
jgi:GDP-L-fucose synthase